VEIPAVDFEVAGIEGREGEGAALLDEDKEVIKLVADRFAKEPNVAFTPEELEEIFGFRKEADLSGWEKIELYGGSVSSKEGNFLKNDKVVNTGISVFDFVTDAQKTIKASTRRYKVKFLR